LNPVIIFGVPVAEVPTNRSAMARTGVPALPRWNSKLTKPGKSGFANASIRPISPIVTDLTGHSDFRICHLFTSYSALFPIFEGVIENRHSGAGSCDLDFRVKSYDTSCTRIQILSPLRI
jgi:hypothetical protein